MKVRKELVNLENHYTTKEALSTELFPTLCSKEEISLLVKRINPNNVNFLFIHFNQVTEEEENQFMEPNSLMKTSKSLTLDLDSYLWLMLEKIVRTFALIISFCANLLTNEI